MWVKQCQKPPMTGDGNHTTKKWGFRALFYPHWRNSWNAVGFAKLHISGNLSNSEISSRNWKKHTGLDNLERPHLAMSLEWWFGLAELSENRQTNPLAPGIPRKSQLLSNHRSLQLKSMIGTHSSGAHSSLLAETCVLSFCWELRWVPAVLSCLISQSGCIQFLDLGIF